MQFPTLVLRQVVEQADRGLLFPAGASAEVRHTAIAIALSRASRGYPAHGTTTSTILHFSRDDIGASAAFRLWRLDWSQTRPLASVGLALPTESILAASLGSGSNVLIECNHAWRNAQGRTARGIFSSFCEAIASGKDCFSGGAPQLVGLYPKWNRLVFGTVFEGKRYIAVQHPGLHHAQEAPDPVHFLAVGFAEFVEATHEIRSSLSLIFNLFLNLIEKRVQFRVDFKQRVFLND